MFWNFGILACGFAKELSDLLDVGCLSDDVFGFVLDGEVSVIHLQLLKKEDKKANPREVCLLYTSDAADE